jgi:hypothetical protein
MKSIKSFDQWESLNEGRYDKLTGDIVKELMLLIKASNNGEENYKEVKVSYFESDDVPPFEDLIDDEIYLDAGTYLDRVSGVDTFVKLVLVRDFSPAFEEDFIIDGHVDEDSATIYVEIAINPDKEPACYSSLSYELRDVVRHEIEHLTQRGWNQNPAKKRRRNFAVRGKIQASKEYHKYYTLADEVDANIHGLYNKAKSMKKPFKEVVMDFIKNRISKGIIPEDKADLVYRIWKKRASEVGGLPEL